MIDSQARVYAVGNNVFGCAGSAGHPYGLGQNPTARPGQERVGRIALAGVDAAYALSQMGVDTFSTQVIVRRLDNGQTLHDVSATTQTLGPEFFQTVETIVVKADGAVAWIAQGGSIVRHEGDFEVDRIDRRGETTLDHSATGNLRSLRLRGSELSWRHGAQVRTATLI